ncbi:PREDICTED: F-box/kelch-repeat protein At3g18720-like [Camelina sativa]|uniref:F-box/kelch-repeat protein At3g18720-like n=1 Tax=Camelina sativa TaxID=90675 RepID=A0ABM0WW52_CAMSA|nr:PREDICTED: F-box/kelch-repeat protein At3g18720-like [Camelina sativa]
MEKTLRDEPHMRLKLATLEVWVNKLNQCVMDQQTKSMPNYSKPVFFFNPFTRERINLPKRSSGNFSCNQLSFSAAPTSSSCLVISLTSYSHENSVITSWRPGETVWKVHRFRYRPPRGMWTKCVFSNGVLYCLSTSGYLSVFDPSKETWNILRVRPWSYPTVGPKEFGRRVLMMENEGDIFVMVLHHPDNNPSVFKLNLKYMKWEEKRDVGGLTIFASYPGSFIRASLSANERNKVYLSAKEPHSVYYSLGDEESSGLPTNIYLSKRIAWVDPPHNNVIL